MRRSGTRQILTTHVGSLPRPDGTDRAGEEDDATLSSLVKEVVERQREIGIHIINEGEYTKGGDWLSYVDSRFDGFEARPPIGGKPLILQGKDGRVRGFLQVCDRTGDLVLRAGRSDQTVTPALGRGRAH